MTPTPAKSSTLPAILLTLLLLLLAVRLNSTESLRETIPQKAARLEADLHPAPGNSVAPFIGPTWIAGYATLTFLVAGAATLLAARRGTVRPRRIGQFFLLAVILAVLLASSFHAADRFSALVGTADITTALVGAWALALLCDDSLLGSRGRHAAIAAIVAILAVGAAKALMQHFVEYPDLIDYVTKNIDEALRCAGISNDPVQKKLFMARVNSAEVSGFGALANVFATEMVALVGLAAGILAATIPLLKRTDKPTRIEKPLGKSSRRVLDYASPQAQIPIGDVAFAALCLTFVIGVFVIPQTDSNGAMGAGIIALLGIVWGAWQWRWIAAHRRAVLAVGVVCVLVGGAAVVTYGMVKHRLPTLSLLYRWHYWTGTVPMIKESPGLGVGLNNFGDYYLRYKLPESPEDVKDPHSFLMRLASESGLPATALVVALALWLVFCAFRASTLKKAQAFPSENSALPAGTKIDTPAGGNWHLLLAAIVALVWIPLHIAAEGDDELTVRMTVIYAVVGWTIYAATRVLLELPPATRASLPARFIPLAGVFAALCMMLYDQVNMALVTGPAAMLFWFLLTLGDGAADPPSNSQTPRTSPTGMAIGAVTLASGLATMIFLLVPLMHHTFPLDPAPHEYDYIRSVMLPESRNDAAALDAINQAIALAPDSGELLMQRLVLKRDRMHLPIADDIRRVLALDHANARIRLDLALPDTDLPPAERVAALREALRLDQLLPPTDFKRLTDEQLEAVHATINRLSGETKP